MAVASGPRESGRSRSAAARRSRSSPDPASSSRATRPCATPSACAPWRPRVGLPLVYKSSFDKANRTSLGVVPRRRHGRGPARSSPTCGARPGLPVLTDVHEREQIAPVAAVVDVLQTPAFLCRQTDFIVAVAACREAGEPEEGAVPLARGDAARGREGARDGEPEPAGDRARLRLRLQQPGVRHARAAGARPRRGCPVVFDATHSVQQPGGAGNGVGRRSRDGADARAGGGRGRRRRGLPRGARGSRPRAAPTARRACGSTTCPRCSASSPRSPAWCARTATR